MIIAENICKCLRYQSIIDCTCILTANISIYSIHMLLRKNKTLLTTKPLLDNDPGVRQGFQGQNIITTNQSTLAVSYNTNIVSIIWECQIQILVV